MSIGNVLILHKTRKNGKSDLNSVRGLACMMLPEWNAKIYNK